MVKRRDRKKVDIRARLSWRVLLLPLFLVVGSGSASAVEDARLLAAQEDHANWLAYGHGYANQRYSGLDRIRV